MTEDIPVPASIPEYNRNVASGKSQLQVIDIIDQIANSVAIFPYENAEPDSGFPLMQDNKEGANHLVDNTACEVSAREKDAQGKQVGNQEKKADISPQETRDWGNESGEGLCEKCPPVSTEEPEITKQEERKPQQPCVAKAYCTNKVAEEEREEGALLWEPEGQMEEETQLAAHKDATEEASDGAEGGIWKGSHIKGQENSRQQFLPTSPSCDSPMENHDEQPSSVKKNDISRHSYSRYNTISYRKIRKGNTKQRIDEFESMMHS